MNIAALAYKGTYMAFWLSVLLGTGCASAPDRAGEGGVEVPASYDGASSQASTADAADSPAVASALAAQLAEDPFPGFKRMLVRGGGLLYLRDDSAFESYDNWFFDKGAIEFTREQIPLTAQEQAELRMLMFRARVNQTKYYGSVVKKPGPCTLAQQLHMKKLQLYKSPTGGPVVNFISSFGEAVIVAEIKDSLTGKIIFAYIEPVRLGRGVTKSASPDLKRLADALGESMERAHRALVEQLPVDPERLDDRQEFGCNGQIGRNVLEIRRVLNQDEG